MELLAGKPNEHSFRKLSECPAVSCCSWETPTEGAARGGRGAPMTSRGVDTEYVGGQSELYHCFPGNGTGSSRKNRKQR